MNSSGLYLMWYTCKMNLPGNFYVNTQTSHYKQFFLSLAHFSTVNLYVFVCFMPLIKELWLSVSNFEMCFLNIKWKEQHFELHLKTIDRQCYALHIVKFLAKMKSLQQNHSELTIGLHMFHRQDNGLSTGWHNRIADAVISKVSFTIVIKFYHHSKVLLFWGQERNMALTGDPLQKPGRCDRSWAIFVSYMFLTFC